MSLRCIFKCNQMLSRNLDRFHDREDLDSMNPPNTMPPDLGLSQVCIKNINKTSDFKLLD